MQLIFIMWILSAIALTALSIHRRGRSSGILSGLWAGEKWAILILTQLRVWSLSPDVLVGAFGFILVFEIIAAALLIKTEWTGIRR